MRPTDIEVPAEGRLQQTVYVFRYESSWCGRRDQTFPTQEKAEEAWIAAVTADPQQRTDLLELRRSNERAFLERMNELRDPMDNFCIFAQDFGLTMPTAIPPNQLVRSSGMRYEEGDPAALLSPVQ
jgi:hypothetical protein